MLLSILVLHAPRRRSAEIKTGMLSMKNRNPFTRKRQSLGSDIGERLFDVLFTSSRFSLHALNFRSMAEKLYLAFNDACKNRQWFRLPLSAHTPVKHVQVGGGKKEGK